MKKLILALLLLGGAAFAAWFFFLRGPGGQPPPLAATLPAAHTAGAAGVSDLVGLAQAFDKAGAKIPKDKLGPMAEAFDPKARAQKLGFDPATPDGWASVGLDPAVGFVVTFDARVTAKGEPLPILLAKVTDEAKLGAWIKKVSGQEAKVGGDALEIGGHKTPYGKRGEYSAVMMAPRPRAEAATEGFRKFLADTTDMSGDEGFKAAFQDAAVAPQVFAFASGSGAKPMLASLKLPKSATEAADFYTQLFPAVGFSGDAKASRVRVAASEKGVEILRKILTPARNAPGFAKFIPASGWGALRFSVNLKDVMDGIAALLPPSVPEQQRNQLSMATMMLPMIAGFSWDDLVAAFSGHFAFAFDVTALSSLQGGNISALKGVMLAGVADGEKADKLLKQLVDLAAKGATVAPAEVAGGKGYSVEIMGQKPVVVRVDDVLIAGPSADAVKAAVETSKGKNLAGTPAGKTLDGDIFYGGAYDVTAMVKALGQQPGTEVAHALKDLGVVHGGLTLDSDGILGETALAGTDTLIALLLNGAVLWLTTSDASTAPTPQPADIEVPPVPAPPPVPPPAPVPANP